MARPTVATERREQIIDATLQTVAQHGIAGTSLDRIAEAVGMSRGHVRHFVGNRDQLLAETARRVFSDDAGRLTILPDEVTTFAEALDFLFGEDFTRSDAENAVVLGFVELSRTTPAIAEILAEAYASTRRTLAAFAVTAYPRADAETCELVADGTLSAALGNVFMGDFDQDEVRTARVRRAVEKLLAAI
ncbi:TetR/AcrR family transcriptional regulator [Microbacterium sp. TPD7012]|uniref:TetR/AcrR family transcriptional regulator n=1 Tax=Microbacterium sp. TPD7012 TaxID=2171975 RepID=UPI000D51892A|nr:TetR/AcrR family transcriptional regulator [Microbacterium sp. TPD7012]PVE98613.1 TetR/AcrR family transcriptional regulator [Microbacterium sp. TPD7012]